MNELRKDVRTLLPHLSETGLEPGTVQHIEVRHEEGCPRLAETDVCICNPEAENGVTVNH